MVPPLHVLLFQSASLRKRADGKVEKDPKRAPGWVAICLEHNVLADGDTIQEAMEAFGSTLAAEILCALEAGKPPLQDIAPAPARYHELWKKAVALAEPILFHALEDEEETPIPALDAARMAAAFTSLPRSAEVRLNG